MLIHIPLKRMSLFNKLFSQQESFGFLPVTQEIKLLKTKLFPTKTKLQPEFKLMNLTTKEFLRLLTASIRANKKLSLACPILPKNLLSQINLTQLSHLMKSQSALSKFSPNINTPSFPITMIPKSLKVTTFLMTATSNATITAWSLKDLFHLQSYKSASKSSATVSMMHLSQNP